MTRRFIAANRLRGRQQQDGFNYPALSLWLLWSATVGVMLTHQQAHAVTEVIEIKTPADARLHGLASLRRAVQEDGGVPLPDNLDDFIKDRQTALQLGKALFWDMQVGSDGVQACASCHFHAGADSRTKNQLNPGLLTFLDERDGDIKGYSNAAGTVSPPLFEIKQPNQRLRRKDFPFVKSIQRFTRSLDGAIQPEWNNSNDIASSMGVFFTLFDRVRPGLAVDEGSSLPDPIWNFYNILNVRRVEPRNTPSVINAVFNFTNFWEGRANPHFNGQNPFGDQDLNAAVFVNQPETGLAFQRISLNNASLASQALAPLTSSFEMSFGDPAQGNGRTLPEIGKKLLSRSPLTGLPLTPLGLQRVHRRDAVLGELSTAPFRGLSISYEDMIKKAFVEQYWNSAQLFQAPSNETFTQMDANFGLFFGLAVMMYQSTLVSDQSPFDQWMETGDFNDGFDETELAGLNLFVDEGQCITCHGGPEFTNASVRSAQGGTNAIRAMAMAQGTSLYDNGFYNIAVTPTTDDIGRGSPNPFGQPLAFARQALFDRLSISGVTFPIIGNDHIPAVDEDLGLAVCEDSNGNNICEPDEPIQPEFQRVAVDGAFKTPGLRNSHLTGPYFHNGGMATLRQVVQFYNRGGNFCQFNLKDLDPSIEPLGLSSTQEEQLVAFMVALTDDRVRYRQAPFDHPELRIPFDGLDTFGLHWISAVGAHGSHRPLKTFLHLDPQDAIFTPLDVCVRESS